MKTEYEATYINVDKDEIRNRLRDAGAELVKPEFLQKRAVFNLPAGHEIDGGWLRVRDEQDRITMTLKVVDGNRIENQREIEMEISDFESGRSLLSAMGATEKSYQENRRELWSIDGVDVTIDEWPFLEPYVEIEGQSEDSVRAVSEKLGFDYDDAMFCSVGTIYAKKYGIDEDIINYRTPKIVFEMDNPFAG
ncbi:CYTH domain-containing protein [Candidatus Uhrbacteria bacterium]|nr:CYTH domain-containing protein [Candidatus Uhrbacteria bacterium]